MYKVDCMYKVCPPDWKMAGDVATQNTKLYTYALSTESLAAGSNVTRRIQRLYLYI